jgi:hypothetical protein
MLGATVQFFFALASYRPGFVLPYLNIYLSEQKVAEIYDTVVAVVSYLSSLVTLCCIDCPLYIAVSCLGCAVVNCLVCTVVVVLSVLLSSYV